ncbi:hypothetical protein Tco_0877801 [Tanacetum coccineum]|uniref:Reverse transcriptase domain-containing protein n=1 Tax=Tanacetum coccineum TaxID=301880 RepID=A0ABQ5BW30_9ASTR
MKSTCVRSHMFEVAWDAYTRENGDIVVVLSVQYDNQREVIENSSITMLDGWLCADNVTRRCVAGSEILEILAHCHSGPTGGHHSASVTRRKVYESGFFCPNIFKDAKDYVMRIKHEAHWALKQCNMDLTYAIKNHFMELNELAKLRDGAYENTRIYKERAKRWHYSRLRGDKDFKVGDKVLLFNSHLRMHLGKLKSKWYGPNVVKTVYPYEAVEITNKNGFSFKVNGQRLKKYFEVNIDIENEEIVKLGDEATELRS